MSLHGTLLAPLAWTASFFISSCAASGPKHSSSSTAQAPPAQAHPTAFTEVMAPASAPQSPTSACPSFSEGQALYTFRQSELSEVSGLVASRHIPELLWMLNDSGDGARLYGISGGKLRYKTTLSGIEAIDFEDIALVPQATGPDSIYIADTGDNFGTRHEVTIYRIAEPDASSLEPTGEVQVDTIDRVHVRYPGGPQDIEALFVDPLTKDLYLLEKGRSGVNSVYQVERPSMHGEHVEAKKISSVKLGLVTAADISHDGRSILVRTYLDVFFWRRAQGQSIQAALSQPPCSLPHVDEPQGESIAFSADGHQYFTLSEGIGQPVYVYKRSPIP